MNKSKYTLKEIANVFNTSKKDIVEALTLDRPDSALRDQVQEGHIEEEYLDELIENYVRSNRIKPEKIAIPDVLETNEEQWARTIVAMYRQPFSYGSVTPNQGEIIRDLVLCLKPEVIVEIGCYIGVSSIWMASALEEIGATSILHSIDLFNTILPAPPKRWGYLKDPLQYAHDAASSAGLEKRIRFHKMNSIKLGKNYDRHIGRNADLLYIDGDHYIGGCITDFLLYYPHVNVGGTIVLHDIYPENCGWEGPRYLIDRYLRHADSLEVEEVETVPNYGFAFIKKTRADKRFEPGGCFSLDMRRYTHAFLQKTANVVNWKKLRHSNIGRMLKRSLPFK